MAGTYMMTVEENPAHEDIETVRWGLSNFNRQHAGDDTFYPLNLFVRDASGAVAGGLLGSTYWSWLYVDTLWLAEPLRRHGWGGRLLSRAEEIATARGCIGVHLDTTSFQARDFYEKQGYAVWGILDDLPPGHQRIFLRKRLSMAPSHPLPPLRGGERGM